MSNSSTVESLNPDAIYSSAGAYWPGWIWYSLLLLPTFVFNVVTGSLILSSPVLRRNLNSILVVFLALEDGLLSLCCLVQCLTNLAEMQIALDLTGCEIQAIYLLFFVLNTGYTLCCIAYYNHQRIQGLVGWSLRQLVVIHVLMWCWSALITWLSIDGPNSTRPRVMPSSTYCFSNLMELQSALLFFVPGAIFIGSFLMHRYWLIYRYISRQQRVIIPYKQVVDAASSGASSSGSSHSSIHSSEDDGSATPSQAVGSPMPMVVVSPGDSSMMPRELSSPRPCVSPSPRPSPKPSPKLAPVTETCMAQADQETHDMPRHNSVVSSSLPQESIQRRIRAARKMFAFVLCFFLCSVPVLIMSIYELAANTAAPGMVSLFVGTLVHANSLVNPLLYFWTNPKALKSVPLLKRYWHD